jgi:hypothetical protein
MGWQVIEVTVSQDGKQMRGDGRGPRVGVSVGSEGGTRPRECGGSLGEFLGRRVGAVRRYARIEELNALGTRWEGNLGGGAKFGEGGGESHGNVHLLLGSNPIRFTLGGSICFAIARAVLHSLSIHVATINSVTLSVLVAAASACVVAAALC